MRSGAERRAVLRQASPCSDPPTSPQPRVLNRGSSTSMHHPGDALADSDSDLETNSDSSIDAGRCAWYAWRQTWDVAFALFPHAIRQRSRASCAAVRLVLGILYRDLEGVRCGCKAEFVRGQLYVLHRLDILGNDRLVMEGLVDMLARLDRAIGNVSSCH